MNSRIEHEIDCPRHPLGGSPNDCTCGLAALEAKAAQWDALDSARMESLIRDDAADAARYRKIKAAVAVGNKFDLYFDSPQTMTIRLYNGMYEQASGTGPTLDEAVDQLPAVVPTDREEAK